MEPETDPRRVFRERPLVVLLAVGVAIRLLVFDLVAVSNDTGLFLYDARLILEGNTPIVDYPTRSPLFHYALAAVLGLTGGLSRIVAARLFMIVVGALLGVALFRLTAELHSRRAGFAAAALFFVTPVAVVYGIPVKTELAAQLLAVASLLFVARHADDESVPYFAMLPAGLLLGAAFLVRRIALVHLVAVAIFLCYYRVWHWKRSLVDPIAAIAVLYASAGLAVVVGYVALAWPDLGLLGSVAEQHALSSFLGTGTGNVAWIEQPLTAGTEAPSAGGGLVSLVCQGCDAGTARIIMWSAVVSLPAVLPLLVYGRAVVDRFAPESVQRAVPVALAFCSVAGAAVGGALFARHASASPLVVVGPALVALAGIWYVWRAPSPDFARLLTLRLGLPALVLALPTAAYLYRDSPVSVWYMLDLVPYVCVLAGAAVVELLPAGGPTVDRVKLGSVVLAAAVIVGTIASVPFLPARSTLGEGASGLESVSDVQAASADVDRRTAEGSRVLTADALFVSDSDRRLAADLSRGFWLLKHTPGSPGARKMETALVDSVESGRAEYVVVGKRTRTLLNRSDAVATAVEENYCPVDAAFYRSHDATLLTRSPDAPGCSS